MASVHDWVGDVDMVEVQYAPLGTKGSTFAAIADQVDGPGANSTAELTVKIIQHTLEHTDKVVRGDSGDLDTQRQKLYTLALTASEPEYDGHVGRWVFKALSDLLRAEVFLWPRNGAHDPIRIGKDLFPGTQALHFVYDQMGNVSSLRLRHQLVGPARVVATFGSPFQATFTSNDSGGLMTPRTPPPQQVLSDAAETAHPDKFDDHLPSAAKSTGSMFALTEQDLVAAELIMAGAEHSQTQPLDTLVVTQPAAQQENTPPLRQAEAVDDNFQLPKPPLPASPAKRARMTPKKIQQPMERYLVKADGDEDQSTSSVDFSEPEESEGEEDAAQNVKKQRCEQALTWSRYQGFADVLKHWLNGNKTCYACGNDYVTPTPSTGRYKQLCVKHAVMDVQGSCKLAHVRRLADTPGNRPRKLRSETADQYCSLEKALEEGKFPHQTMEPEAQLAFFKTFIGPDTPRRAGIDTLPIAEQLTYYRDLAMKVLLCIRLHRFHHKVKSGETFTTKQQEVAARMGNEPAAKAYLNDFRTVRRAKNIPDRRVVAINSCFPGGKFADEVYPRCKTTFAINGEAFLAADMRFEVAPTIRSPVAWLSVGKISENCGGGNTFTEKEYTQTLEVLVPAVGRVLQGSSPKTPTFIVAHDKLTALNRPKLERLSGESSLTIPVIHGKHSGTGFLNPCYANGLAKNIKQQLLFATSQIQDLSLSVEDRMVLATVQVVNAINDPLMHQGHVVKEAWKKTTTMLPNGTLIR